MVRAFTIYEVVINAVIIGIIMSMVYGAYLFFSSQTYMYSRVNMERFEVSSFYNNFKFDAYMSEKIYYTGNNTLEIVFYDEKKVNYFAKDSYLFREKEGKKDSIPISKVEFDFLGSEGNTYITSISLTALLLDDEVNLYIHKEYPPYYLLNGE